MNIDLALFSEDELRELGECEGVVILPKDIRSYMVMYDICLKQFEEQAHKIWESPSLPRAIATLQKTLKEDEGYYYVWQSNIAMAFYDEVCMNPAKYMDENDWHKIANQSAKNFLNNLIWKS